jgi:hypothetical protein
MPTTSTIDQHVLPVRDAMNRLRDAITVAFGPKTVTHETLDSAPAPAKEAQSC